MWFANKWFEWSGSWLMLNDNLNEVVKCEVCNMYYDVSRSFCLVGLNPCPDLTVNAKMKAKSGEAWGFVRQKNYIEKDMRVNRRWETIYEWAFIHKTWSDSINSLLLQWKLRIQSCTTAVIKSMTWLYQSVTVSRQFKLKLINLSGYKLIWLLVILQDFSWSCSKK